MATDFFANQEEARRNTVRLVILFVLAVVALIASIDLLLAAVLSYAGRGGGAFAPSLAVDPGVLVVSSFGTLFIVSSGSLYKIAQLRSGGRVVAEGLGGRRLYRDGASPSEQTVLNVVEEMAIASGVPAPPVFLMDDEPGINAFAAGFTPSDAVMGITRGAADRLTRDELQGVVAHEFSHILNGDMRLNIRLMGVLHGILIIGMLGYFIVRSMSRVRIRRSKNGGGALVAIFVLGVGLMVLGYLGTLFGNLIQAAVSRQRELLADASSVQFTRYPAGLAGALKKIGALPAGSRVESPSAAEASHMFFCRATGGFAGLFSTHPPLAERIRRIDPSWDGTFPLLPPIQTPSADAAIGAETGSGRPSASATAGFASALAFIGRPGEVHIGYAARIRQQIPEALSSAAHEPFGARALVYAMLIGAEPKPRRAQLAYLSESAERGVFDDTQRLLPLVERLDVRARLPLIDMLLPALRALTSAQHEAFGRNVNALVYADERLDLFEWSLRRILRQEVDASRTAAGPTPVTYRTVAAVKVPCEVLFSALAQAGERSPAAVSTAFELARTALGLPEATLRASKDIEPDTLDAALAALERAAPDVKRRVLQAVVVAISADREVTATEAELLRVVSASLGVPIPPLVF